MMGVRKCKKRVFHYALLNKRKHQSLTFNFHAMKHTLSLLAVVLLTTLSVNVYAQKNKTDNDYNLKKAYEVLQEEKDEAKALDLVTKQLRETPDNVEALLLRVRLLRRKKEFGQALQDINHALKVNKPKKTEMQNSTLHWWKAYIYQDMGDKVNAAASFKTAYELAQKDDKENLQSISFDYAQALYDLEDYAGADAIYRKMLALDEADQAAMIGLARNMIEREQYSEAIEMLDKCQKYDADYSEIYRFKMQAYDKLGEASKAVDAGLEWFEKNDDANTEAIGKVLLKRPNYAEASIKTRIKKTEKRFQCMAFLCQFYVALAFDDLFHVGVTSFPAVHGVDHPAVVLAVQHGQGETQLSAHLIESVILDDPKLLIISFQPAVDLTDIGPVLLGYLQDRIHFRETLFHALF